MTDEPRRKTPRGEQDPAVEKETLRDVDDLRDLETEERDQDDVRGGTPNYSSLC